MPPKTAVKVKAKKKRTPKPEEGVDEPPADDLHDVTVVLGDSGSTTEPVIVPELRRSWVEEQDVDTLHEIVLKKKQALEDALKEDSKHEGNDDGILRRLFEDYQKAEENYKKVAEKDENVSITIFNRCCGGVAKLPDAQGEEEEQPEPQDLATNQESYMHAVVLLVDGGTEGFRSLTYFESNVLQRAMCYMFIKGGVYKTFSRIADFLIFLLSEARLRAEEDVERGEALTLLHGEIQQTLVVFVEKLCVSEQEQLWYSREGLKILMQLQLADARLFFARPNLQRIMFDLWRGVRPENYDRSLLKQLKVWAMLLMAGLGNLVLLVVWALVPEIERRCNWWIIETAEEALKSERGLWPSWSMQQKKKKRTSKSSEQDALGVKVLQRTCWNEAAYNRAVRDCLRARVFKVQRLLPLLIPRHKKYLAILTNMAFAVYLTMESPEGPNIISVSIISLGAWTAEVHQLLGFAGAEEVELRRDSFRTRYSQSIYFWFMDRVNIMELMAFTCIGCGSALCLIDEELTEFAQGFKAVGVLFLAISQSMAMLRMSSVFGPLVSISMNMIVDMIQWGLLLIPIIGCFVAALLTLFKARESVNSPNCLQFNSTAEDYLLGVLMFFETQIGEDAPMEKENCLLQHQHRWAGQLIMNFGLWMIVILMLNMLIAMMAKTFDRIYEGAMVDFQFSFVGNVIQSVDESAVPPVLRSFSIPYDAVNWMIQRFTGWNWEMKDLPKFAPTEQQNEKIALRRSATDGIRREVEEAKKNNEIEDDEDKDDQELLHLPSLVTKFLDSHAADAAVQDKIWRRQFARQLFSMDSKVNKLLRQQEDLKESHEEIQDIQDAMEGVVSRDEPSFRKTSLGLARCFAAKFRGGLGSLRLEVNRSGSCVSYVRSRRRKSHG